MIRWLPDSLFNRRALQEFILIAAQYPSGGLRDKPPKQARIYFYFLYLWLMLHAGLRTPTILLTAYRACLRPSTVCALRLRGGQRYVRHGRETMASVLRLLPRLSAGQRKKGVLTSSVQPRTVSYVVYLLVSTCLVAKRPAECHTSAFQSNHHTHRGHHGTFL